MQQRNYTSIRPLISQFRSLPSHLSKDFRSHLEFDYQPVPYVIVTDAHKQEEKKENIGNKVAVHELYVISLRGR
ncbi:hypothetical protein TNCT_86751 [Trichonephila clavata]|uniref:Uncharacterized protein n=1 Tax=Trichonephila clavata TaxID=2740835 RepID=A0A8X6GZB0_TRICU|nr:hypothetical protein TNCT_86751 [Trichonephila clavata]